MTTMDVGDPPRVLCVDDDSRLLEGLERTLAFRFDVTTATSGRGGLQVIDADDPFAVVVSDMRMPEMDGATFLSHVKKASPDSVRILLTGQTDQLTAVEAVNKGEIFRFLNKPCPAPVLLEALVAAVTQHRLITAERVLLEQTLRGSVKTLIDVLALANPQAFGRATRVKHHVVAMLDRIAVPDRWAVEVAAMLSQVPAVTLPPDTIERFYAGNPLSKPEQAMVEKLPALAESLFSSIPRLEPVLEILRHQYGAFLGERPSPSPVAEPISVGAHVLRIAQHFETLTARGVPVEGALDKLRASPTVFDPAVLSSFRDICVEEQGDQTVSKVTLRDLKVGMILAEDICTRDGVLVIRTGNEVTAALLHRLANFASGAGLREPLLVKSAHHAPPPVGPRR